MPCDRAASVVPAQARQNVDVVMPAPATLRSRHVNCLASGAPMRPPLDWLGGPTRPGAEIWSRTLSRVKRGRARALFSPADPHVAVWRPRCRSGGPWSYKCRVLGAPFGRLCNLGVLSQVHAGTHNAPVMATRALCDFGHHRMTELQTRSPVRSSGSCPVRSTRRGACVSARLALTKNTRSRLASSRYGCSRREDGQCR